MTDVFYNRFGYRQTLLEVLEIDLDSYKRMLVKKYCPVILDRYLETEKDIQIQIAYIDHEGE